MGLAASQARLLTITARKADCEFQSMNLSHQKLALARNMEKISNDYQQALNTTKLVYDYYGSGMSDMPLTYGLLMTPSIYNDYYPKLVTDSKNRVILNSQYAAAARAAGIPAEGYLGTPSSDVRNAFIDALADAGIISSHKAATIQGTPYCNALGNGVTSASAATTTDITYQQLIDLIKTNCAGTADYGIPLGYPGALQMEKPQRLTIVNKGGGLSEQLSTSNLNPTNIKLEDLLKNNQQYIISYESNEGGKDNRKDGHTPTQSLFMLQSVVTNNFLPWLGEQFTAVLGGIPANEAAIQYAYNAVFDILYPNDDLYLNTVMIAGGNTAGWNRDVLAQNGTKVKQNRNHDGYERDVALTSSSYVGMVYSLNESGKWFCTRTNDNTTVAVNLNNLTQVFMTAMVDYLTEFENGYSYKMGTLGSCNLYNGEKNKRFQFTIPVEVEEMEEDTQLYANFYDTLFNRICLDGWTENDQIDDADYMAEMFRNNMAYISSMNDAGFYIQSMYSTDRTILEVRDDDAIAKSEAKYNAEKAKIQNKEDTIDMKMKNLDTEISSLTTEYDTTKSLITKAIEKSFKRYDA